MVQALSRRALRSHAGYACSVARRDRFLLYLGSALSGVFAVACSHGPKAVPAAKLAIRWAPQVAPASHYNAAELPKAPSSQAHRQLLARLRDIARSSNKPLPKADPRLSLLAIELARAAAQQGAPPSAQVVEFTRAHLGIIDPWPLVAFVKTSDVAVVADHLASDLGDKLPKSGSVRMGVGWWPVRSETKSLQEVAVVLQASFVETEPIPRRVPKGATLPIRGRISAAFRDPRLAVTAPDGNVRELRPSTKHRRFSAAVECGSQAGEHQVEILADGQYGATVLANFPVWCGARPADSIMVHAGAGRLSESDLGALEVDLLQRVNAERKRMGLGPVAAHPQAAQVARAHSQDMRDHGFVGHVSPSTGSPADRAKRAGLVAPLLLENAALAGSVAEAHQGLMGSPGHRANILNPHVTHLGVGVVTKKSADGSVHLYATQVFVQVLGRMDLDEVRAQVRAKVDEQRKQASRRALARDGDLDRLAQEYADRLANGDNDQARLAADLSSRLDSFSQRYSSVGMSAAVLKGPGKIAVVNVGKRSARACGVGVAYGEHPQLGANTLFVVILLGHKLAG